MKKTIYISGPISGNDQAEMRFKSAELFLKEKGFKVVNPMKLNHEAARQIKDEREAWCAFMKTDIKALMDCDAIYMLDGWEKSKGAVVEHSLAYQLGLEMTNECYPWVLDTLLKQ